MTTTINFLYNIKCVVICCGYNKRINCVKQYKKIQEYLRKLDISGYVFINNADQTVIRKEYCENTRYSSRFYLEGESTADSDSDKSVYSDDLHEKDNATNEEGSEEEEDTMADYDTIIKDMKELEDNIFNHEILANNSGYYAESMIVFKFEEYCMLLENIIQFLDKCLRPLQYCYLGNVFEFVYNQDVCGDTLFITMDEESG